MFLLRHTIKGVNNLKKKRNKLAARDNSPKLIISKAYKTLGGWIKEQSLFLIIQGFTEV